MPQVLSSHLPHLQVAPLQRRQSRYGEECHEGEERGEYRDHMTAQNADMDFFVDEYESPAPLAAADSSNNNNDNDAEACGRCDVHDDGRVVMCCPKRAAQTLQGAYNQQSDLVADCEVSLQLHAADDGRGLRFAIRIPAAVSLFVSPVESFGSPTNNTSLRHMHEVPKVEEAEEKGAAMACDWSDVSSTRDMSLERVAEAAHFPHHANAEELLDGRWAMRKVSHSTGDAETLLRHHDVPCPTSSAVAATGVYVMELPPSFVLNLHLPPEVEKTLVEWQREELIVEQLPPSPPPLWILAFLYTTNLRHQFFTPLLSTDPSVMRRKLVEESTAVAALEGLCIVALNIVAQMGHLRQQQRTQIRCSNAEMMMTAAQHGLLDDVGLFSTLQEERVRRWLQRYMPLEVHIGEEERDASSRQRHFVSPWPSAVAVVFYIALDLARVLFPSLLGSLESTVLTALQPLLEVCDAESMVRSSCTSSLCQPPSRRHAVVLLTQRPATWWLWWRQNDTNKNGNNFGCTNVVSASMGYSAIRVLHYFTLIHEPLAADGAEFIPMGVEESEVAEFLLSAPTLFKELLLDREVTGILERSAKRVTLLCHTPDGRCSNEQLDAAAVPWVTRALMRCFLALLCWLSFRPTGYSSSAARVQFGLLLRLTASFHERQMQRNSSCGKESGEQSSYLLAMCSHDYFSLASTLLRGLRDGCDVRRRRRAGNRVQTSGVNPWRQLRHCGEAENLVSAEEVWATRTSRSHRSVCSFLSSTTVSTDSAIAPRLSSTPVLATHHVWATNCSAHSLQTLRSVLRDLRSVLRLLKRDVFDANNTPEAAGDVTIGMKRCRELDISASEELALLAVGREETGDGGYATFLPWQHRARLQLGVSPHLAYHVYGMPDPSRWNWHMECDDSSDDDDDATNTSGAGSGSAGTTTTTTTTSNSSSSSSSNKGPI